MLDPKKGEGWLETRVLRSKFLETILLHEPYRSALPRQGVRIDGAWFTESLDLSYATLVQQLWLDYSRFESPVDLTYLQAPQLVSLEGSTFTGEVKLLRAKIGGHLDMSESKFNGKLIMDSIELVRSIEGYDSVTVSIFTPYHGTELRAVAVQNDWLDSKIITKHTTSRSLLDMPTPYVSADDIDGIAAVAPLYCYFDKSVWGQLRRAEVDDEEGLAIRKRYQDNYAEDFLGEDQNAEKVLVGGTGCRSNPKDSFRISPSRLTDMQLDSLVI